MGKITLRGPFYQIQFQIKSPPMLKFENLKTWFVKDRFNDPMFLITYWYSSKLCSLKVYHRCGWKG